MTLDTENTTLLNKGHLKTHSHFIDVLEKPLYNGYASILAEDDFSASLTLEELLLFIDDPWWQKLRRTLFCTFCLVFWLILFTGCTLAYKERNKQCGNSIASTATPAITSTIMAATIQSS